MTRQAGVHVGHGDPCEHAADEQVRVWNKVCAVSLLLFKLNKRNDVFDSAKHPKRSLLRSPKYKDRHRGKKGYTDG